MTQEIHEGVDENFEVAFEKAHDKIQRSAKKDFTTSKVVGFGLQTGGFFDKKLFYVQVIEDVDAPFKTE